MELILQPTLENEIVSIQPLKQEHFEILYKVASDPLIWEQHPKKDRYKRDVFEVFFKEAIASYGAFLVFNSRTKEAIGSSRYYDFDKNLKTVVIGYTFLARNYWGTTYNRALKLLMLNHAFQFVDIVFFHIGATNFRSQKAIERLGAKIVSQIELKAPNEPAKLNFVYQIEKKDWEAIKQELLEGISNNYDIFKHTPPPS